MFKPSDSDCRVWLHGYLTHDRTSTLQLAKLIKVLVKQFHYESTRLTEVEVEEVAQEVLIKIFQSGHTLRSHCPAWIRKVVYHTCIDCLRQRKKNGVEPYKLVDQSVDADNDEFVIEPSNEHELTPEQLVSLEQCLELVLDHIRRGKAGESDMHLLKGVAQELDYAELAAQVGRTKAAVTNRLSELRKLMQQLRETLC